MREQSYPCSVVAVTRQVAIRPSADGKHPDPYTGLLTVVARDRSGRLFTRAAKSNDLLAWNPDGSFHSVLAQQGQGPGEMSSQIVTLFVDGADSLHVRDASGRWLVFDPERKYSREFRAPRSKQVVHHYGAGLVSTAPIPGGTDTSVIHLTDLEGNHLRSLGQPRPGNGHDVRAQRPSALGPDGSIWIAPQRGMGEGYVFERRSLTGDLLQLLRRDVPWLPIGGYPDLPTSPQFVVLSVDQDGLLWIAIGVKDPRWRAPVRGAPPLPEFDQMDVRFEVVDPRNGRVLASVRYDTVDSGNLPPIYPVGRFSRETWGLRRDSSGIRSIELFTLHLAARR